MKSFTEVKQFDNGDVAVRLIPALREQMEDKPSQWIVIRQSPDLAAGPPLTVIMMTDEQVASASTMFTMDHGSRPSR